MLAKEALCFVTGRLVGLHFGPWAANFEGVRAGAETIACKIQYILDNRRGIRDEQRDVWVGTPAHNVGLTNFFDISKDAGEEAA